MKTNKLFEEIMSNVPKDVQVSIDLSFDIVDRIYDILQSKGMTQKDLAVKLGKTEAEVCKWMRGTHNFTLSTISKIENALGEKILTVTPKRERSAILVQFKTSYNQSKSDMVCKSVSGANKITRVYGN